MKILILDFDGTIADTQTTIVKTTQATMDALGFPHADEDEIKKTIGLPLRENFVRACRISDEEMIEKALVTYRDLFWREATKYVTTFPNVNETFAELFKRGIVITVASSRSMESLTTLLENIHLKQYCSMIVGEQCVVNKKPAPDMVNLILQTQKTLPDDALVVGDTIFDIAMGQGAHCKTCGVTYGNQSRSELEKQGATYLIDDFGDLLKLVDEI